MERIKQIKVCEFTQREIEVFLQRANSHPMRKHFFYYGAKIIRWNKRQKK